MTSFQITPEAAWELESGSPDSSTSAVLVLDEDIAYLLGSEWCIVVLDAWSKLDNTVLELAEKLKGQGNLDWRVLWAKELQKEVLKFVPYKGNRFIDILAERHRGAQTVQGEDVRKFVEELSPSIMGEGYNLTALYEQGKAKPQYLGEPSGKKHKTSNKRPISYCFRIENRVLVVNGGFFRGFHALGLPMSVPTEAYGGLGIPPIGARTDDGQAFGTILPMENSRITTDDFGRKLYKDPAQMSWLSIERAVELVTHPDAYNPLHTPITWSLDETLEEGGWTTKHLQHGISALRWFGYGDDDLALLYEEAKVPALQLLHGAALAQAEAALETYKTSEPTPWKASALRSRTQGLCNLVEAIQEALGEELDLGIIPNLVELAEEAA
jgi:hypothetical protein